MGSDRVRDQRIEQVVSLVPPADMLGEQPLRPEQEEVVLQGREFELFTVDLNTDRDGHTVASRPNQITSQFGVDSTSGLSWGQ